MTARPSSIPALDSMRFVGVLAVVMTHVGFHAAIYNSGTFGHVVSRLAVGVAIFFVLSGFLLSREWILRAQERSGAPSTGRYLWKRLWRIYPAYLLCVVVIMVAMPENRGDSSGAWLRALTMTDIYTGDLLPTGFTQTWSLSTEVSFYLLLPVLMWAMLGNCRNGLSKWRIAAVLGATAVVSVWWLLYVAEHDSLSHLATPTWLPAYLSWFGAGIALAVLHSAPGLFPRLYAGVRTLAQSPGVCWALAAALLLVASTPIAGPWLLEPMTGVEELVRHVLYLGVGVGVIIPAAFGDPQSRWVAFLSHRSLRHLGHISYSMFLTHMAVLLVILRAGDFGEFGGNFWLLLVLTLIGSWAVSELLYRFVELPLTKVGRLGSMRAETATPKATSTK